MQEVGLIEEDLNNTTRECEGLLESLHSSAVDRTGQHRHHINLWEERASVLLNASSDSRLDLLLLQVLTSRASAADAPCC